MDPIAFRSRVSRPDMDLRIHRYRTEMRVYLRAGVVIFLWLREIVQEELGTASYVAI